MLFDIGGVLADFAGLAALRELTGESELDVATRWLMSPSVRSFESGQCSEPEFAAGVIAEWDFPFTPDHFLTLFLGWLSDPFPGAEQLVRDTAAQVTVGCLSNTNALHWRSKISKWQLAALFDYRLLSYELGVVKPDREIFELAATRVGAPPERILFLDDNVLNVEGAQAAGLAAEQARGPVEARVVLDRYVLLG